MKLKTLAAALGVLLSGAASAAPAFVNGLAIDGATLDLSGGTSVNNGRVGFFSDIYYDPNRNEWWGLSDRGPGGGTLHYDTRMQRFTLDVNAATGAISNFRIAETVVFKSAGQPPPRQNSCHLDRILNSGAMMRERLGAIRTRIQRQSGGAVAAAGECNGGVGCT